MQTPEESARTVLSNVGWDGRLPVNPAQIARCYEIDIHRDAELAGGSNSGRCVATEDGARIILVNPTDSLQRQRFTIAHELGHALLHGEGLHHRDDTRYSLKKFKHVEVEANRFAAELLMPREYVEAAVSSGIRFEELAEKFGVSQIAMKIRLEKLGLV